MGHIEFWKSQPLECWHREVLYTSKSDPIRVYLHRVSKCPPNFPAGYYWYGDSRNGSGRPPKWIDRLLPAQNSPWPDPAHGTEELPEVDSDSEEDPGEVTELEPEPGPSADQPPIAQGNQQQPTRIRSRTWTVIPPNYYC